MDTTRIEELLEQIVSQNQDILSALEGMTQELRVINEELNWVEANSMAKQLVDGMDSIEASIESLSHGG